MGLNPDFWRGRRVLVSGHTGFKGSWLTLWLQRLGARVTGLALAPSTTPALFDLARVGTDIDDRRGDICDQHVTAAALAAARPSIVLHLAAQSLVRDSYADPVGTYVTNVLGTLRLLEAVRQSPEVRAVLIVTSDKCYANDESGRAFTETDPLGGRDPYSSSKACAELVTAAYRSSFLQSVGIAVATVRAGNVIGGGDWSRDRLIPDAVRAWTRGECLTLRHPQATRPWQHVFEPLAGYLRLAEGLVTHGDRYDSAWNLASAADAGSVETVIAHAAAAWGPQARWQVVSQTHLAEAKMLALDSAKATRELGWRCHWSLERAIQETMAWYRHRNTMSDMRAFSLQQISEYSRDADL